MPKIRLGIRISEDVKGVLLKIRESKEYEKFQEEFKKAMAEGEGNVLMEEYRVFKITKERTLKAIYESTYGILMRLIGPHRSTEDEKLYRIRAIRGYKRHIRTLLKRNCIKIIPDIYKFLEEELDRGFEHFISCMLLKHY